MRAVIAGCDPVLLGGAVAGAQPFDPDGPRHRRGCRIEDVYGRPRICPSDFR